MEERQSLHTFLLVYFVSLPPFCNASQIPGQGRTCFLQGRGGEGRRQKQNKHSSGFPSSSSLLNNGECYSHMYFPSMDVPKKRICLHKEFTMLSDWMSMLSLDKRTSVFATFRCLLVWADQIYDWGSNPIHFSSADTAMPMRCAWQHQVEAVTEASSR